MITDRAVYRDGRRTAEPADLEELYAECGEPGAFGWLGLDQPTREELDEVARVFGLHEQAVEDAVKPHQRPRLERYGETLFLELRPARYLDESETVEFGEVELFVGSGFVITVRYGDGPAPEVVRERLEARPDILRRGPMAVVSAILAQVVESYEPVVAGLENDIDEIEDELFGGSGHVSRRLYELTREVIGFQRATGPLVDIVAGLLDEPALPPDDRKYLGRVHDLAIRVQEHANGFRALLQNLFNVNLTLETKALGEASHRQNEQVKRISAWAAILFAPTLVGTIYGMNFEHMPELGWRLGYPYALGLMVLCSLGLYVLFRNRGWI
jgi:magnesium transporter